MKEIYLVYGINAGELTCYSYRMILGSPTFIHAFDTKDAASAYFRKKVIEIARDEKLNGRFFSHLTDEELFSETPDVKLDDSPDYIWFREDKEGMAWEFFKDELDYDLLDPMPPRVYMEKVTVWDNENVREKDNERY